MDNVADKSKVDKAKLKDKFKVRQRDEDLKTILNLREGRRYLWGILEEAGVFTSSFTGNSHTFFNEGKRDMGLRVLSHITESNPDAFLKMMVESKENKNV